MNLERYPLHSLAKELESCQESQFQLILKKLASPVYIDEQLLKSELALVITKISKLLRSSEDYDVWKGCHAAVVFCTYNPLVLCCHGGQLLSIIYSKLEQKAEYHSSSCQDICEKMALDSLVFAVSTIIELMRNKPTLSREHLVPKLKAIMPCLIGLTRWEPELCLPVLKSLLFKHSTTFRPFANKYRQVLTNLICNEYTRLNKKTQRLVCEDYAYLHLIKLQAQGGHDDSQAHHKSFQDETWRVGILSVLAQFKPVLELCDEILELDHDQDLKNLIKSLSYETFYQNDLPTVDKLLPGLKLDLNEPMTLWQIPQRLHLLVDLLLPFLSLPTPYAVRIPLNACHLLFEALLSLTTNFLPLKREIRRDAELVSVISEILPCVQFAGIRLISVMIETFGKSCLSILPSILGSLEFFIPTQPKSKKVDIKKCNMLKPEFLQVFELLNMLFPHMGHQFFEFDLFTKLIEVALASLEDVQLVKHLIDGKHDNSHSNKNGSNKKQKKESSLGALSDMYTHSEQFIVKTPFSWYDQVNLFLRGLLSNWKLPSSQQAKIIRYSINTALTFRQEFGYIPDSFVQLLRTEVTYPGNERVSILPIAVSLLKGSCDDVFDLLCHPRLPMSVVHHISKLNTTEKELEEEKPESDIELENQASLGEVIEEPHVMDTSSGSKENKRSRPESLMEQAKRQKFINEVPIFQEQKTEIQKTYEEPQFIPNGADNEVEVGKARIEETETEKSIAETVMDRATEEESSSESDSELVIPQIALSDDDDDEVEN